VKYFVLTVATDEHSPFTHKYFIKGHELDEIVRQMRKYSNGILATNKFNLYTPHMKYSFVREINLLEFSHIDPRDFAIINEKKSYDVLELT
jgi:hypothetical protein